MFRILVGVFVLMAASVVAVGMIDRGVQAPVEADASPPQPLAPQEPTNARMVVMESEDGQFAADARVDGRPVDFMVDTGAQRIAIRATDAARLGYRPNARDYVIRTATANGEGRAAPIELGRVEIGGIMVRNVPALVVPDDALNVNLLGMSFLSRVRWTQERGRLVLEQ